MRPPRNIKGLTMTIARKLQDYIDGTGIAYDTVAHHRTATTSQSAQAAHVPGSRLAKSVVVHHEMGYVLAVVPSTHRIELSHVAGVMNRRLGLASEDEVSTLFADCDIGAVPPIGSAYDVPVMLDESLDDARRRLFRRRRPQDAGACERTELPQPDEGCAGRSLQPPTVMSRFWVARLAAADADLMLRAGLIMPNPMYQKCTRRRASPAISEFTEDWGRKWRAGRDETGHSHVIVIAVDF